MTDAVGSLGQGQGTVRWTQPRVVSPWADPATAQSWTLVDSHEPATRTDYNVHIPAAVTFNDEPAPPSASLLSRKLLCIGLAVASNVVGASAMMLPTDVLAGELNATTVSTTETHATGYRTASYGSAPVVLHVDDATGSLTSTLPGKLPSQPQSAEPGQPPTDDELHALHVATYPRPPTHKGDYVSHGVNYSALMSDEEFTDAKAMTTQNIQDYLDVKGSFLAHYEQDGESAASIIAAAAQEAHINPRVILATLEKENHLLSRTRTPERWVMRSAMGFAYSDGGGTAGRHSNFRYQVEGGARLLRQLYDEGADVKFPTARSVDYGHRTVKVNNAATWALLRYTPHTRDTHLRQVGGGNHLFVQVMRRMNVEMRTIKNVAVAVNG